MTIGISIGLTCDNKYPRYFFTVSRIFIYYFKQLRFLQLQDRMYLQ